MKSYIIFKTMNKEMETYSVYTFAALYEFFFKECVKNINFQTKSYNLFHKVCQ